MPSWLLIGQLYSPRWVSTFKPSVGATGGYVADGNAAHRRCCSVAATARAEMKLFGRFRCCPRSMSRPHPFCSPGDQSFYFETFACLCPESLNQLLVRARVCVCFMFYAFSGRRTTSVDFVDSKKWRAGGLWMIILGCISAAFCIVIGNFQPRCVWARVLSRE